MDPTAIWYEAFSEKEKPPSATDRRLSFFRANDCAVFRSSYILSSDMDRVANLG